MRPLTVGEILDAGVSVLRKRPIVLLVAAALAAAEQGVLHLVRSRLGVGRLSFGDIIDSFGAMWTTTAVGMGTEALTIALLGGLCGPAAIRLLMGSPGLKSDPVRLRGRWLATVTTAIVVGGGAIACFYLGGVGWLFWFMLTGLAVPVLTIDGGVPDSTGHKLGAIAAFGRAVGFAARGGLFAGRVRLLAYTPWLLVRLALNLTSGASVAGLVGITSPTAATAIEYALWIVVNGLMYATIACVDAATLLETRMRVEGLDIAVHQATRLGQSLESAVAAPR
jgi:hypothetical protein